MGETVGYRVRMQSRISARTRIEVVTEGVFSRMILGDPTLEGVGLVILVGDDPASAVYVRNKVKACHEHGLHSVLEQYLVQWSSDREKRSNHWTARSVLLDGAKELLQRYDRAFLVKM